MLRVPQDELKEKFEASKATEARAGEASASAETFSVRCLSVKEEDVKRAPGDALSSESRITGIMEVESLALTRLSTRLLTNSDTSSRGQQPSRIRP